MLSCHTNVCVALIPVEIFSFCCVNFVEQTAKLQFLDPVQKLTTVCVFFQQMFSFPTVSLCFSLTKITINTCILENNAKWENNTFLYLLHLIMHISITLKKCCVPFVCGMTGKQCLS